MLKSSSAKKFARSRRAWFALIFVTALNPALAQVEMGLSTPITPLLLDNAVTAEWVNGVQTSRTEFIEPQNRVHFPLPLNWIMVMPGKRLGWSGISFGAQGEAGVRHLRIGLREVIDAGTVITHGNITAVSVLAVAATYPGNLGNDQEWIQARSRESGNLGVWTLPTGTRTRALRFSHTSSVSDKQFGGQLLGAYVMAQPYHNIASEAFAFASSNTATASLATDAKYESLWEIGERRLQPISREDPETITLTWPKSVDLRGVCASYALFRDTEVQIFTGPQDLNPREGRDQQWETVAQGMAEDRQPETLNLNWFDFGRTVQTRGLRLRVLSPAKEGHYTAGQTKGGRKGALAELMAFSPGAGALQKSIVEQSRLRAPIPVSFSLAEAANVTLVIEDADGKRVRNLVSDTPYAAGKHTIYWDGLDESGRIDGPYAGIYRTVGHLVKPGTYSVRGLTHKPVNLSYEFSVNSPGSTPWLTGSHWGNGAGAWLADHSSPSAVLFLPGNSPGGGKPGLLMASPIAESSHGIIWTDLEGRKTDGKLWVGGNWTGASHLVRDAGPNAVVATYAYSGAVFEDKLRLVSFQQDKYFNLPTYTFPSKELASLGGLAAHNAIVVASLPKSNLLVLVDAAKNKILGTIPFTDGRGLAFDKAGRLWATSGKSLVRFDVKTLAGLTDTLRSGTAIVDAPKGESVVTTGLEDPQQLTWDTQGNLYVSDWGKSHQVKVFRSDGTLLRVLGAPGGAQLGLYNSNRMDRPYGLTVTSNQQLWVAESSAAPKRISVWTLDGKLVKAFYGGPQYGGGGTLDPRQPHFYYGPEGYDVGLKFTLDWEKGSSQLQSIYWLPGKGGTSFPQRTAPQTPIYWQGRRYMTDAYNSRPIGGARSASIWLMQGEVAQPTASVGQASDWPIVAGEAYKSRWPQAGGPGTAGWNKLMYAWSDLNDDGNVEPAEVTFAPGQQGSLTVNEKLEFCNAAATVYAPVRFTKGGAPIYDLASGKALLPGFYMNEVSSGSGQILATKDGWAVASGGPVRGIFNGQLKWTYPNEWPGQQAGVFSVAPTRRGELMATARMMGGTVTPLNSDAGEIWAVNGDKGNVFLMTTDGLFVATLFHDIRTAPKTWTFPTAERGLRLNDVTCSDEDFWTTITQKTDGKVYLVAGKSHSSIVRVDGLESVKRLKAPSVVVTNDLLVKAADYRVQLDFERLARIGRDRMTVALDTEAPVVDGNLDEWMTDQWRTVYENVDERLNSQVGGRIEASLRVADGKLYAAYRAREGSFLDNAGDAWQVLFKTGGGLDLMLGTNPAADAKRTAPAAGDLRLLVTLMKGKPTAVLYRPIAADKAPASFSSPWRSITFDQVLDVSSHLELARKGGNYEYSIPLAVLGLSVQDGAEIRGDIGVLRGNGFQTIQRLYWVNKSTSTVADVPTEATLTPQLWGIFKFQTR